MVRKNNGKRKVLMVDRGISFGGSLVVIARLAKALDKERYEPVVVSSMDWETIRHHLPDSIRVYRVTEPIDYVMWAKILRLLRAIKPRFLLKPALYFSIFIQLLANSVYLIKITGIILLERIDLLHNNNSPTATLAAKMTGRATLMHLHGYSPGKSKGMSAVLFKNHNGFVSISQYIAQVAIDDGIPAEKIKMIHNPIAEQQTEMDNEEKVELRAKFGLDSEQVVVGVFGRLVSWKGQLELLHAVKTLRDKGVAFQLLVVGDDGEGYGDYIVGLKEFVEENDLSNRVVFAGYIVDVTPMYQISDIVVHASIEPEPFGLVITEAAQNGCAVVCSVHGAGPELVDDGIDGLIVDPKDAVRLAEKIESLIRDPKMRMRMAAKGKERVIESLSLAQYAKKMSAVYDDILARR